MREMTTTKSVREALPEKKKTKSSASAVQSPLLHRDHSAAMDSVRVLSATNSLSKTVMITSDCTYRTSVRCRGALEVRLLERATCLEALLTEAPPRKRSRYYDLTQKNKQKKNIVKTSEREVLQKCV